MAVPRELTSAIDEVMRANGFHRKKAAWNRRSEHLFDALDIQRSDNSDTVTVNCGVFDPHAHELIFAVSKPAFVLPSDCALNARIGQIADTGDRWWDLNDASTAAQMAHHVAAYAIPFLERMHDPAVALSFLPGPQLRGAGYPPPIIYRAILQHRIGDPSGACDSLRKLRTSTQSGPWAERIGKIMSALECR